MSLKNILKNTLTLIICCLLINMAANAQIKNLTKKATDKIGSGKEKAENEAEPKPEAEVKKALPAEIIFSNQEYKNFEEAKSNTITKVSDGDVVWMYIKFPSAIENFVDADPNNKDKDGKVRKFLNMGIGRKEEPNGDLRHCNITALEEETASNELKIGLSPGVVRKGPSVTCFLDFASGSDPIIREIELRVYGMVNNSKTLIGRSALTVDLTSGKAKYTAINDDFKKRISKGPVEHNKVPKQGTFADPSFKNMALKQIKAKGIDPIKIYYSVNDWETLYVNQSNRKDHRSLYGAYTYKKGDKCLYGVFEIVQDWIEARGQWAESRIELRDDVPVNCNQVQ